MSKVAVNYPGFRLEIQTPAREAFDIFRRLDAALVAGGRAGLEEAIVTEQAGPFVTIKAREPVTP